MAHVAAIAEAGNPNSFGRDSSWEGTPLAAAAGQITDSILVVDDDADVRESLCRVLQVAGYHVHEAANGNSAINVTESHPIDLIITDIMMPVKEGIETISDVRRSHPKMKVIAISGRQKYLQWAEKLGADRTLGKPFNTDDLLSAIDSLLEAA